MAVGLPGSSTSIYSGTTACPAAAGAGKEQRKQRLTMEIYFPENPHIYSGKSPDSINIFICAIRQRKSIIFYKKTSLHRPWTSPPPEVGPWEA